MSASPLLDPLSSLCESVVSFVPLFAQEPTSFPRGPGYYFHPAKLIVVLLIYFAWLRTCWWVHSDTMSMKLPT